MSTKIKTIDLKSDNAGIQFVESLHHTGFAILYNHPLDHNLITSVYDEWGDFFNSDAKHSYTFNPDTQDGYFPYRCENAKGYSVKDLKEFYNLYEWGKYPENVSKKALLLFYELMAIGICTASFIKAPHYYTFSFKSNFSSRGNKRTDFKGYS